VRINMVKLFVDAHVFDYPHSEGVATYLKGLYTAAISIVSNVEFYFAAHDTEKLVSIFGKHNHVHYLRYSGTNKWKRLGYEISRIIEQNKIDIAHFQYISPLRKVCKEIVTTHDVLFLDFPQYFPFSYRMTKNVLFKRSAHRAEMLFTVSEYSKQAIALHYNITPNNIYITPNAVSSDFYVADNQLLDEVKNKYGFNRYILYVSRFEPRKNHITLAKAFMSSKLWQKGLNLVFVGKESIYAKEYFRWYDDLPLYRRQDIVHISQLTFDELLSVYKGCELFIYPSIAEGFGIPPLEAVAAGRPCLCSNATAMKDFDFLSKSFFDPNNTEELTMKMLHFFDGNLSLDTYKAQAHIKEKYNWNSIAEYFLETIQKKL